MGHRIVPTVPDPWSRSARASPEDALADWAASGVLSLTGSAEGPPLLPPGHAATVARSLSDHLEHVTDGRVRLDGRRLLGERAAFTGGVRRGSISVGGSCHLLRTADGWASVSCARADDRLLLGALIEQELAAVPWPAVAAWLADHTGEELATRAAVLGVAASPVRLRDRPPGLPQPQPRRDVAGLLVVDFSSLWAGPLCAHLLGLAGARVVKVETPSRPDGARRGAAGFYRLLHAGHRSIVVDPETREGRAVLARLVQAADIVIEASRPRALIGFGLDAAAAAAAGTTWVSITAAGRVSGRIGFGDDIAAGAGLVAWTPDGTPVFVGDAIADPLTGLTAAALAMSAPPGGGGVLWDVSMADVVAATLPVGGTTPSPSRQAVLGPDGWSVQGERGPVRVAEPSMRHVSGEAPPPGAHTADVLRELRSATP